MDLTQFERKVVDQCIQQCSEILRRFENEPNTPEKREQIIAALEWSIAQNPPGK